MLSRTTAHTHTHTQDHIGVVQVTSWDSDSESLNSQCCSVTDVTKSADLISSVFTDV